MTCAHCCDTSNFFDAKAARKELKRYYKKGPTGTTKAILSALSPIKKNNKSLLDIGGGIGVIQWEFLKAGAQHTTDIDAATGYIRQAQELSLEYDYEDKTTFLQGDFNDLAEELEPFDFVTLDRVVCCYPDYEQLLKNSLTKTKEYIALSYPISNIISRMVNQVARIYFKIKKSAFKTYIHPTQDIEHLIEKSGFQPMHKSMKFPWLIRVYKRV